MPRARWLKPEFFKDRKIGQLGPGPALVYQALWILADDGGVAPCDPDRIKGELFYSWPGVGLEEIGEWTRVLEEAGRITRYQVGDDVYCTIPKFLQHQKIKNPSAFRYPRATPGLPQPSPSPTPTSNLVTSNLETSHLLTTGADAPSQNGTNEGPTYGDCMKVIRTRFGLAEEELKRQGSMLKALGRRGHTWETLLEILVGMADLAADGELGTTPNVRLIYNTTDESGTLWERAQHRARAGKRRRQTRPRGEERDATPLRDLLPQSGGADGTR